jgi:hypothetical protein
VSEARACCDHPERESAKDLKGKATPAILVVLAILAIAEERQEFRGFNKDA